MPPPRFVRAYPPAPPRPGLAAFDDAATAAEDDQVESEAIWLPFLNGELLARTMPDDSLALLRGSAARLRCVFVEGDAILQGHGDNPGEELSLPLARPEPLYLG